MRKFFLKFLPHKKTLKNNRWLKPFGRYLHHPNLWHLNRRSAAGGLAVGLFCGLIPGPFQVISAMLLCVWRRVNLPLAVLTTFYTNPLTIVPLYLVAYEIGVWLTGSQNGLETVRLPDLHWHNWASELTHWVMQLGEPLLIGVPVLALGLAIIGYVVARFGWRMAVILKWRARQRRHSS